MCRLSIWYVDVDTDLYWSGIAYLVSSELRSVISILEAVSGKNARTYNQIFSSSVIFSCVSPIDVKFLQIKQDVLEGTYHA
jgi:hypothetical protein